MPGNKKKRRSQIEAPMQLNYLRVGEYFTVTDGGRDLYKKLDDVKELVTKYGVSVEIVNYSQLETLPMAMSVYRVTEHRLIKTKDDDEDFQDWDDGNLEGIPEGDCEEDDVKDDGVKVTSIWLRSSGDGCVEVLASIDNVWKVVIPPTFALGTTISQVAGIHGLLQSRVSDYSPDDDCEQVDFTPIEKIRQFHQTVKNIPSTPLCIIKYKAATEDLTNALIDELERQDTRLNSQKISIDRLRKHLNLPFREKVKGKG